MRSLIPLITSIFTLVVAQTPEGFAPEAPASLVVTFENDKQVTPVGLLLERSAVAKQPTIRLQDGSLPTAQFMQFIVDVDVPAQDGTKTTFLHLAQSNLDAGNSASNSTTTTSNGTAEARGNSTSVGAAAPYANTTSVSSASSNNTGAVSVASNSSIIEASYLQPSPPAGDGPHKYVVLVFEQPSGFTVPPQFANVLSTSDSSPDVRLGFDMNAFVQASGLGTPLGGTFFTVENSASNGTATAGSNGTASAASSESSTTAGAQAAGSAAATFTGSAARQAPASILGLAILFGALSVGLV